jgi:vacuolar-type H+-ATPase subunit C/Vma6
MVKLLTSLLLLIQLSYGVNFDKQCLECHQKLELGFDKFYMHYLIKYSSTKRIKQAMFTYLKEPIKKKSIMDVAVIDWLGIMPTLKITDKELKELIDIYLSRFDVRNSLH